jgi:hypothetical protein
VTVHAKSVIVVAPKLNANEQEPETVPCARKSVNCLNGDAVVSGTLRTFTHVKPQGDPEMVGTAFEDVDLA